MSSYDVRQIASALRAKHPPKEITQQPFEHSPKVFQRLCKTSDQLRGDDLQEYMQDLLYTEVQVELFRFLLPKCLGLWKENLLGRDANRAGRAIEETFFPALHRNNNLQNALSDSELEIVRKFVIQAILELIDNQRSFSVEDNRDTYQIFGAISAYAVVFPKLEELWNNCWNLLTVGRALTVLRYISIFMYRDDDNPLFLPWTRERGGGPPNLTETNCHFYQCHWKEENIDFITDIITAEYLQETLNKASKQVFDVEEISDLSRKMIQEFQHQAPTLYGRLNDIPRLTCDLDEHFWSDDERQK